MKKQIGSLISKLRPFIKSEDLIALILLVLGIGGFIDGPIPYIPNVTDYYKEMRTELIGIGITVLIIENALQYRNLNEEKRRLIIMLSSPIKALTQEALFYINSRGWLSDGTLENKDFSGADLSESNITNGKFKQSIFTSVDLSKSICENADFSDANLYDVDFTQANLSGANLDNCILDYSILLNATISKSQLMQSQSLIGCKLPDGQILSEDNWKTEIEEWEEKTGWLL